MASPVTADPFKTLDQISESDRARVGGKAYNCARLRQARFPVPAGLVVPADVSDEEVAGLEADPWFAGTPDPTLFAVRSSGLAEDSADDSFAGIHETQLNVERSRVVDAVLACRRSADSEQARAYRTARHLPGDVVRMGVLVQCMVPAVRSGVAFTVNPVTGADELVVNSIAGLGDALVSGLVTPDEQHLPKDDRSELAALLVAVERHYGSPQDIEWCFDGERYWIVQSRPVTTHRRAVERPLPADGSRDIEWTRANLAEVLPDQLSPQALDLYVDLLDAGERRFFGRLMAPKSELGPVIKAFHGRLYFNLSQLRRVTITVGAAFADTLRSLGHPGQIRPEDEIAVRPPLGMFVRALPDLVRLVVTDLRMAHVFRRHQARTAAALARLTQVDPRTLSDREIWDTVQWWLDVAPESIPPVFVMSSVQAREDILRKAARRVGMTYDQLVYPQLAAGERSVSSQQAFDLVALANVARREPRTATYLRAADGTFSGFRTALSGTAFLASFDAFLASYGHRGRYESDWSIPRMHENPAPVLFVIREQLNGPEQDPADIAARQSAAAHAAWEAFEGRLTWWQRCTLLRRVRATVGALKQQYLWREQVRSDLTRVLSALRPWHLVLANRFVERGWIGRRDDYFLLHLGEVKRAVDDPERGRELSAIAAERAAELAAERDLEMPLFMRGSDVLPLVARTTSPGTARDYALTGLCVSPGAVEADVVVMRDPSEFSTMKRGAILVAPATDPSWTPLFTLASGVIVEVGGMLSHASTIAREYGLPGLANVQHATTMLRTGDRVQLDASAGIVRRL
jgi:pyruvate,water dikinase